MTFDLFYFSVEKPTTKNEKAIRNIALHQFSLHNEFDQLLSIKNNFHLFCFQPYLDRSNLNMFSYVDKIKSSVLWVMIGDFVRIKFIEVSPDIDSVK